MLSYVVVVYSIVPASLRPSMLNKISNPIEEPNTVHVSPETVFWPNMSKDIAAICQACATCGQYGTQTTLEPMLSHPTPRQLWQFVSQDIFELDHQS